MAGTSTANPPATVEIFCVVDSVGDYAVGSDADTARTAYEENIQSLDGSDGFRIVRVVLSVALPSIVSLTGTVPPQGDATLTITTE